MPRFIQLTAVGMTALALVAAGCGGGDSDEDQINDLVNGIADDPLTVCDHLTQRSLDATFKTVDACKEAGEQLGEDEEAGDVEISDLQVDGDTATATITDDDGPDEVRFVKEDGEWKVDGTV